MRSAVSILSALLLALLAVPAVPAHPVCFDDQGTCVYVPADCLDPQTPLTTWLTTGCAPDASGDAVSTVGVAGAIALGVVGLVLQEIGELADFILCDVIGPPLCL